MDGCLGSEVLRTQKTLYDTVIYKEYILGLCPWPWHRLLKPWEFPK